MRKLKIVERKLGRENAWGQQRDELVEIDPRQHSRQYLKTLIHELLHYEFNDLSESRVKQVTATLTKAIWNKNYRRIAK